MKNSCWTIQYCPWGVSFLPFPGQEGAAFSWRACTTCGQIRPEASSTRQESPPGTKGPQHQCTQTALLVPGDTHSFHYLRSPEADWKVHLCFSNWPKPSGMHSSTSLCKCLSFLTPTTFHEISSPALPLPTCCLLSQLCRALSSAVSREGSHSPVPCTLLERTPHHLRSAALQLHYFSPDIWNVSYRGQI